MGAKPGTTEERFWRYARRSDNNGCWAWAGARDHNGYGYMGIKVRQGKNNHTAIRAHRVSWMIHRGPIPRGMCVLHKCDNPQCTNPDHLFLGTRKDNNEDKIIKNRHCGAPGEKNSGAKLTQQQVDEIRAFPRGKPTAAEIAKRFGISKGHVNDIRCGYAWPFPGAPPRWRKKKANERRHLLLTGVHDGG